MNAHIKMLLTAITVIAIGIPANSQGNVKPPVAKAMTNGKAIAVAIQNLSSKEVIVFAGPKDEESNPAARQKTYAGLSTNTLYVSINEQVCIINNGKTASCITVSPEISKLVINAAGTAISKKD